MMMMIASSSRPATREVVVHDGREASDVHAKTSCLVVFERAEKGGVSKIDHRVKGQKSTVV